jgi:chromosome segregation ATPase
LQESQNERDILKKQISDHLVLISNLQIRLDEQRIRAEHIEKQTNTSLEVQNYDLKKSIASLEETISKRDKMIAQLKTNIEETKRRLEDREKELSANKEDEMIVQMQEQLEHLRSENLKLKSKMDKEAQILPNLVENIISDKNSDIEMLKEKLSETEKQLELFACLNLDKKEIESLNKLRLSGVSFCDLVDLEILEKGRRAVNVSDGSLVSPIVRTKTGDKTVFLDNESELSTIEKVGPPNLFYSLQIPHQKANSTEKHVRFEDEVADINRIELEKIIDEKDRIIRDYESRLKCLEDLETKVGQLQSALEETESSLRKATGTFEDEQKKSEEKMKGLRLELEKVSGAFEDQQKKSEERVKDLRLELAAQRCALSEKEDELEECRRELEEERRSIFEKDEDLKAAQKLLAELRSSLKMKDSELKSHEDALKVQYQELKKLQDDATMLKTFRESTEQTVQDKDEDIAQLKKEVDDARKQVVHFQHLVGEKEKVIDQMSADSRSLHVNLETIQSKLQESGNVVDLGRRLREEQKRNSDLYEELHALKAQLLGVDKKSIEDIAGQVQRELDYSAYLDTTLINAVSDGSLENGDVEAYRLALKKQKSINKQLAKAKETVEKKFESLEAKYESLKKELDTIQYEDAALIAELRKKLDGSLRKEVEFDRILKAERNELEGQLKSMKYKISTLSTKAESLPDMQHEYRGLSKMMSRLEEENDQLKRELKKLRDSTSADLAARSSEIASLESKISGLSSNEQVLKDNFASLADVVSRKDKELVRTQALLVSKF